MVRRYINTRKRACELFHVRVLSISNFPLQKLFDYIHSYCGDVWENCLSFKKNIQSLMFPNSASKSVLNVWD